MDTPIHPFEHFKLNRQLLNAIDDAGYQKPTEIQQQAISLILEGHDLLGIAPTGTGKTAAFVLPILMKVKYAQGMHPRAVILAPTRELAMQISEQVQKLSTYLDIRHTCIYGGLGPKTQIEQISKGIDILVATPGRLLDLYLKGDLVLKEVKIFVLDEADKMMDMGFMPQIRRMLEVLPRKRQNLLFSATMPDKVMRLSEEFLEFPLRVEAAPPASTPLQIDQILYEVPNFKTKINLLAHLLIQEEFKRVIVFARTKANAENVGKFIQRKVSPRSRIIHANKGQNTRINAMQAFKDGEVDILVATDVAARGIDVSMVSHVINFDVPIIYEDYVHRIGRTGRAQQDGKAITFMNMAEAYHIAQIEKIIRKQIPKENLPENVVIEETPKEEEIEMLREIDTLKRRENPEFKGAFHEKKSKKHTLTKGRSGGSKRTVKKR